MNMLTSRPGPAAGAAVVARAALALLTLAGPSPAPAQDALPPLVLRQAVPDATTDTLTIDGEHFGPKPFVTLDLVPLDLRLVLDTRLMAAVPVDAMPAGRYLLTVSRGPAPSDRATLEVALGAVVDPPVTRGPDPAVVALPMPAAGAPAVIVGDRTITIAEVDREWQASDPGGYIALMRELHQQRRRVADRMASDDVLAREAAARMLTVEALLAQEVPLRAIPMPDTALAALYESLGERTRGAALEQMRPSLRAWLERKTEPELAKMAYVEELVKTSTRLEVVLETPAVPVTRTDRDPVLGPASAPVEIVLFGDLQSPDYARLAQVFGRVTETFGARVRFVFKLLPAYGPQSASAAEAGACAHAQGRFWAFHEAAARPATLDARRLKAIPGEAGLDQAAFDRCLAGGAFKTRPREAADEAGRYGITSGPAVLVNGRLAPASPPFLPPFEYFTRLIEEELQRQARAGRKGAR
jgi:protein-disulfide isomerase